MTRVTLKEVASKAGVSYQTVSNVINNSDLVREETRARVLAAIQELDYQPHFAARALREARSMTMSCVFFNHTAQEIADPYRNLVQAAVMAEATRTGYSVLSGFLNASEGSLLALRQGYQQRRFDGSIIVGTALDAATLHLLRSWDMPLVLFDYSGLDSGFNQISGEYAQGMSALVDHLVATGRRRLALVAPQRDGGTTAQERQQSFLAAAARHGLDTQIEDGDWSFDSGERAFHTLWNAAGRPDAVVAANDRMAVGCLAAARALSVRVPEQVAITGFDDFETGRYTTPSLTTVHVPYAEMAALAVRTLLDTLGSPDSPVRTVYLPVTLVQRESA